MDQISRLYFDIIGRDKGGSKALNDAAQASDRAHAGFSRLGNSLSNLGGPFEAIVGFAGNLGDAFDQALSKSQRLGLGITAVGVGLTGIAARDQQAQRQLQQAIDNTGGSYSDYQSQIEGAIKQQEGFAHTAHDTQEALNTLTTATQDPIRALSELGDAANLAAEKHISLADAAALLTRAQEGNARALYSLGINLSGTGTRTEQVNKALKELHDRLSGQASASVDTFAGRLKIAETRLHDNLAELGKYGPEITAVGAAVTLYSSALQAKAARTLEDVAATAAETKAEQVNAAARLATADAATVEAAAVQRSAAAQAEAALVSRTSGVGGVGMLGPGRFLRGGLIAGGGYLAATTVGGAVGGSAGRALGDIGGGAAIGAGIGSVVPGVGTLAGAGVGAVVGGLSYLYHTHNADSSAADAAAKANDAYTTALIKEKTAVDTASASIKGQIKTLQDSTSKTIGLSSAQDDLQAAMHAMAQAAFDGGKALSGHTLAAEANRGAVRDAGQKMLDLIQAEKDAHVSGEKVRQSAIDMAKALEHNATEIYGNKAAVDDLLKSLGVMPHQISNSLADLSQLSGQMGSFFTNLAHDAFGWGQNVGAEFEAGWQSGVNGQGTGTASPFADPGHPGYQAPGVSKSAKNYGKQVAKDVISGYAPAVDAAGAKAAQQWMDKMTQLEKSTAQQTLQTFRGIRDQIAGTFNVASLPQLSDSFGSPMGPGDPRKSAHQYVQQLEHWARLLGRLRKQGLNRVMLDQFEQAGVAAIPAMEEILRQHEIPGLNSSERRIQRVGRSVASTDIQATEGKQLEHVLARLPHRLAHELARELHHLNISVSLKETARHRGRRVRNKS